MLDEQELGDYIDSRFTRNLFRLETLDLYDVSSNGDDYRRYVAGETEPTPAHKTTPCPPAMPPFQAPT